MADKKEPPKRREGRQMSEEEIKDWQKAFTDIEEGINALYGGKDDRKGTGNHKKQS